MRQISTEKDIQSRLQDLAEEVAADIVTTDLLHSQELLGAFVSALALAVADQTRRAERRQKQAEGIAAAKASGVRFGRPSQPLPDNFDDIHQAWRGGQMTLSQAASACGMPEGTFYGKAVRKEKAANCAG